MKMKTTTELACVCVLFLGGFLCGQACGDVLYDALLRDLSQQCPYPTGSFDTVQSYIGGANVVGKSFDDQGADDFELSAAYTVTSVTFDRTSFLGILPPEYLVEFFADAGGKPSEVAAVSFVTSSMSADEINNCGALIPPNGAPGYRVTLDLSGEGIELAAGIWWVSFVAITDDDAYGSALRQYERATGGVAHYRDAGLDHGNGFPGDYGEPDWVPWGSIFDWQLGGDLAMRIEGTPAASCPADLTGDGELNFFDISSFLNAFTAMDSAADFDANGEFNFFDISAFLNAFTAGCP